MQKYEDYFKKLQFRLIGADRNNGWCLVFGQKVFAI